MDAGLISRKRRMSKASETVLTTAQLASELPCTVSVETTLTSQRSGNASNQSSSSNPNNQSVPIAKKQHKKREATGLGATGARETKDHGNTIKTLEEEKTTGVREATPPMAHAGDVDAWLEANMPASPMGSFASAMLKHYKEHWWKPFVSDGWHSRTSIAKATGVYTVDLTAWNRLRVDLRDKMLVGGLPPVFEHHNGKPKLKEPVRCDFKAHVGDRMTMAYGEKNKVMHRVEGPNFIEQCDVCLSGQPVSAGV